MSQAGSVTVGSNPRGPIALRPDTGSAVFPVASEIPTLGEKSGTVATMQTYNDGAGNFRIADQTWATQYVVDASTTPGLKGTFTTIQSAINQAVADGGSATSIKTIFIRRGLYTENLVMPANSIQLMGLTENGYANYAQAPIFDVAVQGSVTFTAGAAMWAKNIEFLSSSGAVFNITTAITALNLTNCQIVGSAVDGISVSGGGSVALGLRLTNCYLNAATVSLNTAGDVTCVNTFFGSDITATTTNIDFYSCVFGGTPTMTSNTSTLSIHNSLFLLSWSLVSNAAAQINLYNVSIDDPSVVTCSGAGSVGFGSVIGSLVVTATTQVPLNVSNDSIKVVSASGASYTTKASDAMILVDGNVTATVVPLASPKQGQKHIIKDNAGTAAAHNITVTPSGKNIDGFASSVINTNYASITIVYNGVQWNII